MGWKSAARSWACAWAVLAGALQPAAGADLPRREWTYEAVAASPYWVDFQRELEQRYARTLPGDLASRTCTEWLERARSLADKDGRGGDPVAFCITAVLHELDPVSEYLPPREAARFRASPAMVGVGLELGLTGSNRGVLVVTPIAGGPAQLAGVRAGDRLIEADGVDLRPMSLDDAVHAMRGPPGSRLRLRLLRAGEAEPLEFEIARAAVVVNQVRSRRLPQGPAYLRISRFTANTTGQFREHVERLLAVGGPPSGLVIDLRGNSGGEWTAVVRVVSAFAPEGAPLVGLLERGRVRRQRDTDVLPPSSAYPDALKAGLASLPIVVLVNKNTAAGAELLAQFLREHRQARLLGGTTNGYAHLATVLPIGSDAMVRLATAEMVSPAGVRWQGSGLKPDEALDDLKFSDRTEYGDDDDPHLHRAIERLSQAAAPTASSPP